MEWWINGFVDSGEKHFIIIMISIYDFREETLSGLFNCFVVFIEPFFLNIIVNFEFRFPPLSLSLAAFSF